MRKGEELKTPRYASAAATRDDVPYSRHLELVRDIYFIHEIVVVVYYL